MRNVLCAIIHTQTLMLSILVRMHRGITIDREELIGVREQLDRSLVLAKSS